MDNLKLKITELKTLLDSNELQSPNKHNKIISSIIELSRINRFCYLDYHFHQKELEQNIGGYEAKNYQLKALLQLKKELNEKANRINKMNKMRSCVNEQSPKSLKKEIEKRMTLVEKGQNIKRLCLKKKESNQKMNFITILKGKLKFLKDASQEVINELETKDKTHWIKDPLANQLPFPLFFLYHSALSLQSEKWDINVKITNSNVKNEKNSSQFVLVEIDKDIRLLFSYEKNVMFVEEENYGMRILTSLQPRDEGVLIRSKYAFVWTHMICRIENFPYAITEEWFRNPTTTKMKRISAKEAFQRIIERKKIIESLSKQIRTIKNMKNIKIKQKVEDIDKEEFSEKTKNFFEKNKIQLQGCVFYKFTFNIKKHYLFIRVCIFPDYPKRLSVYEIALETEPNDKNIEYELPLKNYINKGEQYKKDYKIERKQFSENLLEKIYQINEPENEQFSKQMKLIEKCFSKWTEEMSIEINNVGFFQD